MLECQGFAADRTIMHSIGDSHGPDRPAASGAPNQDANRCADSTVSIARLMEQAVLNVPAVDAHAYKGFREKVGRLVPQLPDLPMSAGDRQLVEDVLREFSGYHKCAEKSVREQISGWRKLVTKLLAELLSTAEIDPASADAALLVQGVATLLTGEEIHGYLVQLTEFLRQKSLQGQVEAAAPSAHNHNAAGLRDSASAFEQVKNIIETGAQGYIVLFRLSSLKSIKERYGDETMQDCLMAISAFLTRNLRSDDNIYFWSEDSLLAIMQTPATEQVINMAVQRIVDNNRDITIQMGVRVVMLRVPLIFEVTPIGKLEKAEDLYTISSRQKSKPGKIKASEGRIVQETAVAASQA